MTNPTLSRKYQVEIDRLDDEHEELERLWSKVPYFGTLMAVAPIVGALWGWGAAVVALLVTAALVATRAYLIAVRKSENRWNRERLFDDLHAGDASPPSIEGSSPALHSGSLRGAHV